MKYTQLQYTHAYLHACLLLFPAWLKMRKYSFSIHRKTHLLSALYNNVRNVGERRLQLGWEK